MLVLLGLGATVASFLTAAPWLVTLSRNKEWVFVLSGALIAFNYVYIYRIARPFENQSATCTVGEESACERTGRLSRAVLWISAGFYLVGFFAAFVLGPLLVRFGG